MTTRRSGVGFGAAPEARRGSAMRGQNTAGAGAGT